MPHLLPERIQDGKDSLSTDTPQILVTAPEPGGGPAWGLGKIQLTEGVG